MAGMLLLALAVFIVSSVLAEGEPHGSGATLVLGIFLSRALMLWRAGDATASHARRQIKDGSLEMLHLSQLTSTEISIGWALAGWMRAAPESVILLAGLYPWIAPLGGWAALLPLSGCVALIGYQGITALVTARTVLDHAQRREAVAAGWIISFAVYPIRLWLTLVLLGLLLLVPLVLVLQAVGLVGALVSSVVGPIGLSDMTMGEMVMLSVNAYAFAGIFLLYPLLVFVHLCMRILAEGEVPPRPDGYFEEPAF